MRITKEAVLGFLFLSGLAGLAVATIALTDVTLRRRPKLDVFFEDAKFLKKGDPVHVAGVRSGRVKEVKYALDNPLDRRVKVSLELDRRVALRRDYEIAIVESTLLGGRVVSIDPGRLDQPELPEDTVYLGHARAEHLAALNELIENNKQDVRRFLSAIANTAERIDRGEGTIGQLVRDDAPARELRETLAQVRGAVEDARAGKGTIGRLLVDDALYADARDLGSRLRSIVSRVESGEGTLGALLTRRDLHDRALAFLEDARTAAGSFSRISSRIEAGQGTLGRLLHDSALYERWVAVGEDVRAITTALREGKGTLGRLLNDEELLADLRTALKSLSRQIEDAREAAPIATFAGVLFGVL